MIILDRKITVEEAILLLAESDIMVSTPEAQLILDFLYLMAKNSILPTDIENSMNLKENSNNTKSS